MKIKIQKLLLCYALACFAIPLHANAEIIPTSSITSDTVAKIVANIDRNTLVLVNVDNTLITPQSNMFRQASPYKNLMDSLLAQSTIKPFYKKAIFSWVTSREAVLVEPSWHDFIQNLQAKAQLVIGFTKMHDGVYKTLKNPEEWQYQDLAKLGVRFVEKFKDQPLIDLKGPGEHHAMFYKGILFTGASTKAETLVAFLRLLDTLPKKIVIFEGNKETDVTQLEKVLRPYDLDYYIIRYSGANSLKSKLNYDLMKWQQQQLVSRLEWFEDEIAEQLMTNDTQRQALQNSPPRNITNEAMNEKSPGSITAN